MRLVLLLFTAGRASADGFHPMLWALVYTLSTKVRLSPRGVNAVKKFFPSPRQAWLPRRGSFSLE